MTKRSLLGRARGLALTMPAPLRADDVPVETRLVDVMNKIFASTRLPCQPRQGIVVEGSFTAAPEAAKLSKASLFGGEAIR
jgi:catalase